MAEPPIDWENDPVILTAEVDPIGWTGIGVT
jgi:hypothetical protein